MSLIYGIINHKTNRVKEYLNEIKQGYCPPRVVGSEHWVHENCGLGNMLRYTTPESVFEKMPYTWGANTITANARIDNREQLFQLLDVPKEQQAAMPDSILILKAYESWGEQCVTRLEGDWAFAIWDDTKKLLFIARDRCGNTGLYYYHSNRLMIFASGIKSLLAISEIPKQFNEQFVAGVLTVWKPTGGETAYKNIFELEPGHYLTLRDEQLVKKRYWYIENVPVVNYRSTDDYIERFLELYRNAVKVRLRSLGKVGATLSGGLDSGSVSALAAAELAKQNTRLQTYTSVPSNNITHLFSEKRFGDESVFAEATASFSGNIDIHYIKGEKISIVDAIKQHVNIHERPPHAASNSFWIHELLQTASENGITTLLTGQGGNAGISWQGIPSPETFSEVLKKYKANKLSVATLLKKSVKSILPESGTKYYRTLKTDKALWKQHSAIHPDFAERIQITELMKQKGSDLFRKNKSVPIQRYELLKPYKTSIGTLWQENAYAFGINIWDPTKDKALLEYCFAIPDHLYRQEGYDRYIIRKAMEGILPDNVRLNRLKGIQGLDSQYLVQQHAFEISELLTTFEQYDTINSYLDIKRMKTALEKIVHSVHISNITECNSVLLRGLGAGLFLKQF